jgi:hypothetical protein
LEVEPPVTVAYTRAVVADVLTTRETCPDGPAAEAVAGNTRAMSAPIRHANPVLFMNRKSKAR